MNFKSLKVQFYSLRSRLENTTEDWSALLLSLTDLNDWLGKKEAELIGLSPIGGDESSLRRQQVRAELGLIVWCLTGHCKSVFNKMIN